MQKAAISLTAAACLTVLGVGQADAKPSKLVVSLKASPGQTFQQFSTEAYQLMSRVGAPVASECYVAFGPGLGTVIKGSVSRKIRFGDSRVQISGRVICGKTGTATMKALPKPLGGMAMLAYARAQGGFVVFHPSDASAKTPLNTIAKGTPRGLGVVTPVSPKVAVPAKVVFSAMQRMQKAFQVTLFPLVRY